MFEVFTESFRDRGEDSVKKLIFWVLLINKMAFAALGYLLLNSGF